MTSGRRAKALYLLIAIIVPAFAVGYANAIFTYNHFYAFGAYLLDSGWFSGVIYRNGFSLLNPAIANPNPTYWQLHFSLLFLFGSLLSYLVPLGRVDYYWLWQGLTHAPLGAAVGLLLAPASRPRGTVAIAGIGLVGLVFGFSGQALACMGYPHYEIFLAAGVCIMLAGFASGRPVVAWIGLAAAIATREDGGVHAGSLVAAVLACDLLGKPFPVQRRKVFIMGVVAGIATILMMVAQRKVFHGGSLLQHEYLGDPAYAHVTASVLRLRALALADHAAFVWAPFVVAALVAAVDRDARWLLGYAATLPWFVLNFLAIQELKSEFGIYTGFPFLGGMFWLGAYGVVKHGPHLKSLGRLALVSIATTLGLIANHSSFLRFQIPTMAWPRPVDAAAMRAFGSAVRANPDVYGRLLVDPSVAAFLVESLPPQALLSNEIGRTDLGQFDALSFYQTTFMNKELFVDPIVRGGFTSCARLPNTELLYCTRPDRPLPPGFVRYPFLKGKLQSFDGGGVIEDEGARVFVEAGDPSKLGIYGPLMRLSADHYQVVVELRPASGTSCPAPIRVEPFVFARSESLAKADVVAGGGPVTIDFDLPGNVEPANTEIRFFRAACRYEIVTLVVHAVAR